MPKQWIDILRSNLPKVKSGIDLYVPTEEEICKQYEEEEQEKKTNKLKRFDEVFKMLLLVMTITTSIGLSSYTEIDLFFTLLYLVTAPSLWMLGNLIGSNPLSSEWEILFKIHAWVLALLVTMSTFAKFWLKVSELNSIIKLPISFFTFILTFWLYQYFNEAIGERNRKRHLLIDSIIILWYGTNTIIF